MKSRSWALLLAAVLAVCVGLSIWLLNGKPAAYAQVWSQGELLYTLDLRIDQEVTVKTDSGENILTVRDGKIAVTVADCPDGYCVQRGFCSGGAQIVCLPHRLVIQFVGENGVDGISG